MKYRDIKIFLTNNLCRLLVILLVVQPALFSSQTKAEVPPPEPPPETPETYETLTNDVIKLSSPIVLARSQSAFTVDTVEDGQLTLTYTVINSRDEEVGEILLATTLEPGVTLNTANPVPDQDGQTLAFVLPSIPPHGEVTATLTVDLPVNPGPFTIDYGARAFGNLRTRAVEASVSPTILRSTIGVSGDYLASTIDANTADRYVLEKIGEIGCDPTALFEYVRDEIGYEVYRGSLRGARGTLWSSAGNALDQANLLIALLRACGVPSRYVQGDLSVPDAQELILSMFDPVSRVVGGLEPADLPELGDEDINDLLLNTTQYLPGADELSDPANDPELLDEAKEHFWVEYFDGVNWVSMDPAFNSAQIGESFTSANSSFAEVDDAIRHKVQFKLDTEMLALGATQGFFQVAAGFDDIFKTEDTDLKRFGSLVVQEKTVLDQTFRTVELVGEPVSIGHFVDQLTIPGILTTSFYTYSPWMQIGYNEDLAKGAEYEEVISSAGSNIVAGVFLRLTVTDPQGSEEKLERTIIDRIGHAIRSGEEGEVALDSAGTAPVFSNADIFTVHTLGGLQNKFDTMQEIHHASESESHLESLVESASSQQQELLLAAELEYGGREFLRLTTHAIGKSFLLESGRINHILQKQLLLRSYQDTPRVLIVESRTRSIDGSLSEPSVLIDIRKTPVRTVSPPGSLRLKNIVHRMGWGLMDAEIEAGLLERVMVSPSASIIDVLGEARSQEVPLAIISFFNLDAIDDLDMAADARARIREAAQSGLIVMTPEMTVPVNGVNTTMWLEMDLRTGETYSVAESGGHEAAVSYGFLTSNFTTNYIEGYLEGLEVDLIVPMPWDWGSKGAWLNKAIPPPEFVIIDAICFKVSVSLDIWQLKIDWNVPNPYHFLGCMNGMAVGLWFIVADIFDAAFRDPGLSRFQIDPEPLTIFTSSSKAYISIDLPASIDGNNVTGNLDTGYSRLGEVAMYPKATNGIGASGNYADTASSPNFAASVELSLENATVNLDAVTGSLDVGGTEFQAPLNVGLSGFQGTLNGADNGPTDTVGIDGAFERVLLLSVSPEETATPQGTAVTVVPTIQSNAIDTYTLSAEAPEGWNLVMVEDGMTMISPPAGLNSGTYEVRFQVESQTVPELRSGKTVLVTITPPETPAVDVRIVPDTMFSVPQQSTLIKTAYRIEIQNLSAESGTFNISLSGLPAEDFTLAADSVVVGPGETGIVGVAIHPSTGLLLAGTPISFTATATGIDTGLTDSDSFSFTYPEVVGVLPSLIPSLISSTPGSTVNAELKLISNGNIAETFTLNAQSSNGLVVSGVPASVTLIPGQTLIIPVTINIPPDATVGTTESISVVADLCNGEPQESCTIPPPNQRYANLSLLIGTSETACIYDSVVVGADNDLYEAAGVLYDAGDALSRLSTDPGNVLLQSRAITTGNELTGFLYNANLIDKGNSYRELLLEIESGEVSRVQGALGEVCTVFSGLSGELTTIADQIAHGFKINLTPSGRIISPGDQAVYTVRLESTGSTSSTINLSVNDNLPAGVTGQLNQSEITLDPGQVIDGSSPTPVKVALSSQDALPTAIGFKVTGQVAELPSVSEAAQGSLIVIESSVDVVKVTPDPAYVMNAGDPIAISAELFNAANVTRTVSVAFRVEDSIGNSVMTGTPIITNLSTGYNSNLVDLGSIDTSGLTIGPYTIIVQVQSETGSPIPGREGRGAFLVGVPINVNVTAEPSEIPPGSSEQVLSKVTISSGETSNMSSAFPNQYAKAVGTATGTTNPEAALGYPDHQKATIELTGSLVLDMGEGLDRLSDGPGPDLVIFQSDLDEVFYGCIGTGGNDFCTHPAIPYDCCTGDGTGTCNAKYLVEVAENIGGPYYSLDENDTSVDYRKLGHEFDLLTAGIDSARFVRITPISEAIVVDAVLANHTHQPSTITIEHFTPTPCSDCMKCTPDSIWCYPQFGIVNSPVVGDLTGDGSPEIVATAQTSLQQHETLVINGITKAEEFRVTLPEGSGSDIQVGYTASPALGDIDGDDQAEIVINSEGSANLIAVRADGTKLFSVILGYGRSVSMALENVDDDPYPEILWPGGYRQNDGSPGLEYGINMMSQPVAADIDGDGIAELVMVNSTFGYLAAFKSGGTTPLWQTSNWLLNGFYGHSTARPAVADLDSDGKPDFVVVGSDDTKRKITVIDSGGNVLWQKTLLGVGGRCKVTPQVCSDNSECPTGETCNLYPSTKGASRPAIADINGDGEPEIVLFLWAVPPDQHDYVIALDKNGNELWRTEARDPSGEQPSLSVADLNGDGIYEVLWNGFCSGFTIFDGSSGDIIYRNPRVRSATQQDYPVTADVDADGHLEVVTGSWDGLYIIGNDGGWSSGRQVWNQYDYRITNVNDDLTIPIVQSESWQFHNTYQYQGGGPQHLGVATVEVSHQLGADVTILTEDVVPQPSQVLSQIVEWEQNTFPTLSGKSYFVPVQTPALQPGESVVISENTIVDGSLTLLDNQVIDVSISLGDVSVYAPHIIGIEPSSTTVNAGDVANFEVSIRNLRNISETFTFEILGIDPGQVTIDPSVTLAAGEEVTIPISIATSFSDPGGTVDVIVVATGDQGTIDEAGAQLEVLASQITFVDGGDVHVEVSPVNPTAGQGTSTTVRVIVTNTGDETQTYDLTATLPEDVTGEFQNDSLTVSPGVTSSIETILELYVSPGTSSGAQLFSVTATSNSDPDISDNEEGTLNVSGLGVQIELTPESTLIIPGQNAIFEATVSNIGNQAETFNLSIGGPFAPFACLSGSPPCPESLPVTLGVGESQTVVINVSGLNPFLQQRTMLLAQAVSTTVPQVLATDASAVDIGAYRDVSVEFEPIEINGTSLDTVEYLLKITNSGNACDERYNLTFSSDPAGVILTPETTEFLVPPQKTAGLRISAEPQEYGAFTINATVSAQIDNPLCPALGAAQDSAEATLVLEPVNVCGDGILEENEECDDGNLDDGDCCSSTCTLEPDGSVCDDGNVCTTGDTCSAGICNGTLPGDCPTVLTTSGPCDVNGDGLVNIADDTATPTDPLDAGNVCQELNAVDGFAVTSVTPEEFAAMTEEDLASYNCIVLDTKAANVAGLGTVWQNVIGIDSGSPVLLTNHNALGHAYFNRVLAPPDLPDDRYGPEIFIRDSVIWACSSYRTGIVVFNTASDSANGDGFSAFDSLPADWNILSDSVETNYNALGTDIFTEFETHQIYANVNDQQDPPCDASSIAASSTVLNSIGSFPSAEYYNCPPMYSDGSYNQLFRGFNAEIFDQSEQALSLTNGEDPIPDLFISDSIAIDGFAISVLREANTAPSVDTGDDVTLDEGSTLITTGSFTDPDPNSWTATVDYGDGIGIQPLTLHPDNSFSLDYVYADNGVYTVIVEVVDNDGETGTDTIQVTVNNVAPIVDAGANQTIDEGSVLNLAPATFNDKGTLDTHTATINWGDGSPSEAGTVSESPYGPPGSPTGSSGTVSGSHVYTNDGSFTLTVCVNDDDGSTSCDPLTAIINNSPPTADEISITTIEDTSVGVTLTGSDPGDDDLTFGIDNGPSFGSLFGTSPNLTYTPYPDFYGEDSFSYHADDSLSVSEGATVVITVNSVNDPPVCSDDSATTDEDTAVMIPVTSNDTGGPSNEDQALTVDTVTQATHGVVINNNDGTVTYSPHSNFNGSDSFKYVVSDNEGLSEEANVDVTVNPINDPPTLTANLQSQTVQYSDTIVPVSITASDIDSSLINLSTPDLPNSLSLSFEQCVDIAEVKSCEWILDGQVLVGAGTYDITIYANDGENENDTDVSITVEQEDADVNFDGDNPVGLQVASPGGNSGLFELTAAVFETLPDLANGEPYPGDIGLADVTMILQPVGPGSSVNGICTSNVELNGGYDDLNIVTCTFENVEVNTYTLEVNIAGDYYTGSDEDVLVVYDPSLGFTTGGGWFYWPGTDDPGIGYLGDRTNFGYTMKYNKKGSKVQGSLLMISRLPNKTHYRIKSNALYGLALGETSVDDNVCGWASFSGKSTYLEPGWLEPEGNHEFLTYVEDCNEPGTGVDRFWIEIHDRDGNVIDVISMPVEAYDNAKTIRGGNIVVPHNSK